MVSVAVVAPEMVDPVPVAPLLSWVVPLNHWYVTVDTLVTPTVKLTEPVAQPLKLTGWLPAEIVGAELTAIAAFARPSVVGTLSTTALTLALPVPALPLKVAVAVPLACTDVCAPDNEPFTALKVNGRPISLVKLAVETALFAELVKKLAVTPVVLLPPWHSVALPTVVRNKSRGDVTSDPLPTEVLR